MIAASTSAKPQPPKTLSIVGIADELRAAGMACNCDLDNWQPEPISGHSHVCRIHKAASARFLKSMRGGA